VYFKVHFNNIFTSISNSNIISSSSLQSSQNTLGDDNAGFGDGGLFGTSLIDEVDPDGIVDDFYDIFANPEDPGYPRSPTGRDVTDSSSQPGSPSLGLGGATNDPSGMFHCNGQINKVCIFLII
jgi:hypothetical protein